MPQPLAALDRSPVIARSRSSWRLAADGAPSCRPRRPALDRTARRAGDDDGIPSGKTGGSGLCGAALLLAGAAQAALQDRDLGGNGVTDAVYDTEQDITWLRDASVCDATGVG